jgi:hypothetical protein
MTTVRTENPFPNVPIPAGARLVDDWMDEDTQTPSRCWETRADWGSSPTRTHSRPSRDAPHSDDGASTPFTASSGVVGAAEVSSRDV